MTAKVIYHLLTNAAPVTALITDAEGIAHCYAVNIPQGTPHTVIRFLEASTRPDYCKDGDRSVVDSVRVQIDYYSDTFSKVETLAEAGRNAIDGQSGTIAGKAVSTIYFLDQNDIFEPEEDENGILLFRKSQDYMVRFA